MLVDRRHFAAALAVFVFACGGTPIGGASAHRGPASSGSDGSGDDADDGDLKGLPSPGTPGSTSPAPSSNPSPTKPPAGVTGFRPIIPVRLVDSRDGSGLAPAAFVGTLEPDEERSISLAGLDGTLGASANREALALNIAIIDAQSAGHVAIHPCGSNPGVSMANFGAGETIATLAFARAGNAFCVRSSARANLVVDVIGAFEKGAPSRFSAIARRRVLDSRTVGDRASSFTLPIANVPAGTSSVVAHVTVTDPATAGFATVHRCDEVPSTSTINFAANQTIATEAIVALDGQQRVCITASTATHVIVDLEAVLGSAGALTYVPRDPSRVVDSRGNAPATSFEVTVPSLPAGATMAALHITAVDATAPGFVAAHACGASPDDTSVVNVGVGQARTSLTFAPVDALGRTCLTASVPLQIVADVSGAVAP